MSTLHLRNKPQPLRKAKKIRRRNDQRGLVREDADIVRMANEIAAERAAERHDRIATAAYFRAQQRGFEPGHELEDWLAAEAEVAAPLCLTEPKDWTAVGDATQEQDRIRHVLEARRSALIDRRAAVQRDLRRELDPLVRDSSDRAIQCENDEALNVIEAATASDIAAIDAALQRLNQGLYGICSRCDGAIEPSRLAAVPHAVICMRCARGT